MSGIPTTTLTEARGGVAIPSADVDKLCIVIGPSSIVPAAGSELSLFFSSSSSFITDRGYGNATDVATQIIEETQTPVAMYTTPSSTPGSYGTIDNTDVTGTALFAVDAAVIPYGTFDAWIEIISSGTLGISGITFRWSLDAGRKKWSNTISLGTAYSYTIPNSGVKFTLEPPAAQVTAFIAAAVEARADTLAHLADVVAHDAADTSAAQIALAASSVPTTSAQAWAVLNLCRTALATHLADITAHNGPDGVNTVAHAAATSVQTGIELYVEYKADFNAHLGIALADAVAGLKAATATVAAPVTLTTADLLDAGEALLATYARRLTFTTAGVTPSDAPASADIVGTDHLGAAQTETINLAQTATMVTTTKAWKTITTIDYPAADGTAATIEIGYGKGVHNSADVTNTLSSTTPTQGTLIAGDVGKVRTFGPKWSTSGLEDAFAAILASPYRIGLVAIVGAMSAAEAATVKTGVASLKTAGKRVTAIAEARLPDFEASESDVTWNASVAADYLSFTDSCMHVRATYGLLTDARTGRQYRRTDLAQFVADVVRVPRQVWPDAPADGAMENFLVTDSVGALVGHDEGAMGASTGLSDDDLGNRFGCSFRDALSGSATAVYTTVPWVMYDADEDIKSLPVRRVVNAIEREALAVSFAQLGGTAFYTPADAENNLPAMLTEDARSAIHSSIFAVLNRDFRDDIQNFGDSDQDTGLLQVSAEVTITGGNLVAVPITLRPQVLGFLFKLPLTLAIKQ